MNHNEDIERLVKDRKLRIVTIALLHTDPTYQRDIKEKHRKIVAEFDEDSLGVPLVAERSDGSLWIVDGQQRITALRKLGWSEVRADVFRSDGPVHEAQVFKRVNLDRTALQPMEQFKARLAAQDPTALTIVAGVEAEGFKIGRVGKSVANSSINSDNSKVVGAVNTLIQIHKSFGIDHIRFALKVAATCWDGDRTAVTNRLLMGLAIFFERTERAPDWERLVPRFRSVTVQRILYVASQSSLAGGNAGDYAVADQLVKVYNKRLRKA